MMDYISSMTLLVIANGTFIVKMMLSSSFNYTLSYKVIFTLSVNNEATLIGVNTWLSPPKLVVSIHLCIIHCKHIIHIKMGRFPSTKYNVTCFCFYPHSVFLDVRRRRLHCW